MAVDPAGQSSMFVGTITGQVLVHVRVGGQGSSRARPVKVLGDTESFAAGAITQMDYYPFFEPYLLAGNLSFPQCFRGYIDIV